MQLPEPQYVDSVWCFGPTEDGSHCIDVAKMFFNYRIMLSVRYDGTVHQSADRAYCYYGHGVDDNGLPRSMVQAKVAAMLAAAAWSGIGDPAGFDKRAF